MEGTCLEGDVKEKFGVYPSWSSQGMLHVTQVTSGGGFQSLFLAGILIVQPSACLGRNWRKPGLCPFVIPPIPAMGQGFWEVLSYMGKKFLIVSAICFGAWFWFFHMRETRPPPFILRQTADYVVPICEPHSNSKMGASRLPKISRFWHVISQ